MFHQVSFKCRKVFRHRYTLFGTFHECLKLFRYFYFHSNDTFYCLQEFCRMSCFKEQTDFSFFQFFCQRTVSACTVRIEQITCFFINLLHRFTYLFIGIGFTADFRSNGIVTTLVQIQYPGKITRVAYIHGIGNSMLEVSCPEELWAAVPQADRDALRGVLANDPRPSYQHDPARVYGMEFGGLEVHFTVDDPVLTVRDITRR